MGPQGRQGAQENPCCLCFVTGWLARRKLLRAGGGVALRSKRSVPRAGATPRPTRAAAARRSRSRAGGREARRSNRHGPLAGSEI